MLNANAGPHSGIGLDGVLISRPLLLLEEDYRDAATALMEVYEKPEPAFVLIAPGSEASCREPIRQASLDLLHEVCRAAGENDAGCVVVHRGFSPWIELLDRSYPALLQSLEGLAAIQEEYGVAVAVENMESWEMCHFRDPSFLRPCRMQGFHSAWTSVMPTSTGRWRSSSLQGNPCMSISTITTAPAMPIRRWDAG